MPVQSLQLQIGIALLSHRLQKNVWCNSMTNDGAFSHLSSSICQVTLCINYQKIFGAPLRCGTFAHVFAV